MRFSFYWSWWLLLVFVSICGGITIITYLRLKRPPIAQSFKRLLIGLRIAAILILVACLLQPIRVEKKDITPIPNLLVLVDTTPSMTLTDTNLAEQANSVVESESRLDLVNRWLNQNNLIATFADNASPAEQIQPRLYQFTDNVVTPISGDQLTSSGQKTDLQTVVNRVVEQWRGQPVVGLVLISDGGHNATTFDMDQITKLNLPIYTLGVGNPTPPADVDIEKIEVSPIVYVDQQTSLRAIVRQRGFAGQKAQISLREANDASANTKKGLSTQIITFVGAEFGNDQLRSDSSQVVEFEIAPTSEGVFSYTIELPVLDGELTSENNQKSVTIRAVRSKLRVLSVDGRPRWDYTFLKRSLEQNADIEIESLILRTSPPFPRQSDFRPAGEFPTQVSDLLVYDVIVLGDISTRQLSVRHQQAIVDYVQQFGRAVVFLGGKSALGFNGLVNSELAQLLPIVAPRGCLLRQTEVELGLTQQGRYHPMMQLVTDPDQNQQIWKDLPALSGWFSGFELKSGAITLAKYVRGQSRVPILTYQQSGLGKCLLLAAEGSWRWAFQTTPDNNRTKADNLLGSPYARFWTQTMRWLASRASTKPIHLTTDQVSYQVDEEVKLTIYAYDSNAMPLTNARIQIDVSPYQQPMFQLSATEIGDGIYGVTFIANTDGSYTIKAMASVGSDQIKIRVESSTMEFEKPYLDQDLMMQLAESTGGVYRPLTEVNSIEFADLIPDQRKPVFEVVAHQLWDHPLILILVVSLLGTEWFLRKRRGLV
ncbi:MAG: hypothetical protein QF569_22570 [Candidatus Poribacteria bacterium]|jgi:uncharacterized membrane protein|nr:hypothetical protein [Candidatus Poribacteria bacterium]